MATQRASPRINGKRLFLVTGFSGPEKARLSDIIRKLGGEYIDERAFSDKCTHVVCEVPNRSEKFLGALATGKWIVKNTFLTDSMRANGWVAEATHEWADTGIGQVKAPYLYRAPRRWRRRVEETKHLAFSGWRAVLIIDDAEKRTVFRRVLESGGATAVLTRLPRDVDRTITHIFVKSEHVSMPQLKRWRDENIPCLAPDYIGDFLVEDIAPPFSTRDIFLKEENTKYLDNGARTVESQSSSQASTVSGSQTICKSRRGAKATSSDRETPPPPPPPTIATNTRRQSSAASNNKLKIAPTNAKSGRQTNTTNRVSENQPSTPARSPAEGCGAALEDGKKLLIRIPRIDSSKPKSSSRSPDENNNKKSDANNHTGRERRRTRHQHQINYKTLSECGKISPTDEEKKRNIVMDTTETVGNVVMDTTEAAGIVAMDTTETAADMSVSMESIYGASPRTSLKRKSSRDLNPKPIKRARRYEDALMTSDQQCLLRHNIDNQSLALPISVFITEIFNACYEEQRYYKSLEIFLSYLSSNKYPPPEMLWKMMNIVFTSPGKELTDKAFSALRRMLSLHPPSSATLQTCYIQALEYGSQPAWDFITNLIDSCIDSVTEAPQQYYNSLRLLEFVTSVISVDIFHAENSTDHVDKHHYHPVVAQILWSSTELGFLNFKLKHLMSFVVDSTKEDCDSDLRALLYSLLISSFRALQIVCRESRLNKGKSDVFITEFTKRLTAHVEDLSVLTTVLQHVKNTMFGIGVCCAALDTMDNIVFVDKCNDISLGKILQHYSFCVPKNGAIKTRRSNPLMQLNDSTLNGMAERTQHAPLSKALITNVNKRNNKGETKLHTACMRGNLSLVKQLLLVTSIDVNIRDYAGWTPLHEACNAGYVECVEALLRYKPPKTLLTYFSPAGKKSKTCVVDLYATDQNGTTPLHDAVMNDRVDVARLLVKYGGEKLLQQRNVAGQTPVDLAETDSMREALCCVDDADNSSQMDSSQMSTQSEDLNELYIVNDVVSCCSVNDCRRYLLIVECLLMSFLHVKDLAPDKMPTEKSDEFSSNENWPLLKRLCKYGRKLRRHLSRIVSDDAKDLEPFGAFFVRLEILAEAYNPQL